jgi:hypothetical protein
MPNVIGNFYFKLTTAGHLLGEYSNSGTPWARPECAFRGDDVPYAERQSFVGTYTSTWHEPTGSTVTVTLTIVPRYRPAEQATLFELTWTRRPGGSVMYQGQAMLNDGQLVGNYQSVDS